MAPLPPAVLDIPEQWISPKGGSNYVAVSLPLYEKRSAEVEGFFGRRLAKWSYHLTRVDDRKSFVIFSFADKAEANKFMDAFDGERFDLRDKGGGQNWMKWFKGRGAKRDKSGR